MYQFFPYLILSIFSFVMLIFLAAYCLRYRHNLGVKEFILATLALAWWVFCQAFELMALTLPVKLFWANLLYLGAALSPFAFLMLAMRFSGVDRLLTKKNIAAVLAVYAVFFSLIFTDHYHGLMRTGFTLDTSAVPYVIAKDYGMLYPLYGLFIYSMNAASLVLLLTTAVKKSALYRKQAAILLAGVSFVSLSNIAYILGLSPVKRFEITPAFFGLAALAVFWGIFQHKLLNIMPIARDLIVDRISSGIIVLDSNNVILDINNAALRMFDLSNPEVIGKNMAEIPHLSENLLPGDAPAEQTTITYTSAEKEYLYEIKIHPLHDKKGNRAGTLYIIDDITEKQKNLEKIIRQQQTLSVMRERERMGRELHDSFGQVFGYYNIQAQTVQEYIVQKNYQKALKHLADLIAVSRDLHHQIREHIFNLRGISPINRSFSSTLKQYAAAFSEKFSIPIAISFDDNLPENFPEEKMSVELLKIIQEALYNIHKHAGKCTAQIAFTGRNGFVEVSIADTGIGFDPSRQEESHHYGFSIMRERAQEIGASFEIHSQKNKGTKITLRIAGGDKK